MKEPVIEVTMKYRVGLWDIHDPIIGALEVEEASDEALERIFHALPESTKQLAYSYGSGDTVFRETVYTDIENNIDKYKSLLKND